MQTQITKQLAGYEDLLFSLGNVIQARQEGTAIVDKTINGINSSHIPYDVDFTIHDMLFNIVNGLIGSGGGQLLGTSTVKAIQYMSQDTAETLTLGNIGVPLNGFAVESLTVLNGGSLTITDGSVFKVL